MQDEFFGLGVDPGDVHAATGFVEDLDGAGFGGFGGGGAEVEEEGYGAEEEAYHFSIVYVGWK